MSIAAFVKPVLRRGLLGATVLVGLHGGQAAASSHREAPAIAGEPRLDSTDVYMFNSYETGRKGYVTLMALYDPLQDPFGGPNYFSLDDQAAYDINIDNKGDAQSHIIFRFIPRHVIRGAAVNVGGQNIGVPLVNTGQIGAGGANTGAAVANQNFAETYEVQVAWDVNGVGRTGALSRIGTGLRSFDKPVDYIGAKSLPDYAAYVKNFVYDVNIPIEGCGAGRVFVGQRKDPFVIALGQTFDLINIPKPIGEANAAAGIDNLADKNVTAFVLEVPANCLTAKGDPVIGMWTSASKLTPSPTTPGAMTLVQHSRLGMPLTNELLIGLADKDAWNAARPSQFDATTFLKYVQYPSFPTLVGDLFAAAGVKAPTAFPRQDFVSVFLTGIKGLNQPARVTRMADELRLNTSIAATPQAMQSRLGVIGGDNAGFPNGRRPGDDIVDIDLRVAMGRLYTLGLFGKPADAPSGALDFTDGAYVDAFCTDATFPYLRTPIAGSPGPQPTTYCPGPR